MQAGQNPKIRVAVSDPNLKDKIKINLTGDIDTIHWSIRFNIPLDETTVNDKSMEVTDTDGYVMRTEITYKPEGNGITISPLDSYDEQRYYLLKISKKVCSAKGQSLKSEINILFKLYQGKISESKTIKPDIPVPKSRARPNNYDDLQPLRGKNDLDNYVDNLPKRTRMSLDANGINPLVGIFGFLGVIGGVIAMSFTVIVGSTVLCILGALHILLQWQNKNFRAKMYYNRGVRHFNRMQYQPAKANFEKSVSINPNYELAKYGLVRVGIYK
ncbi:MAG: tetratricopeptide repeat protein [Defluviitaleaceae bacterium]|nr:tetratricopeptide repeat protein [Defluviitaleaceae bacterium]